MTPVRPGERPNRMMEAFEKMAENPPEGLTKHQVKVIKWANEMVFAGRMAANFLRPLDPWAEIEKVNILAARRSLEEALEKGE